MIAKKKKGNDGKIVIKNRRLSEHTQSLGTLYGVQPGVISIVLIFQKYNELLYTSPPLKSDPKSFICALLNLGNILKNSIKEEFK